MEGLDKIYKKNENFVFRKIENETILVPIKDNVGDMGSIYNLNEVAAFVWEQLDGKKSLRDIKHCLSEEYEVTGEEAEDDQDGQGDHQPMTSSSPSARKLVRQHSHDGVRQHVPQPSEHEDGSHHSKTEPHLRGVVGRQVDRQGNREGRQWQGRGTEGRQAPGGQFRSVHDRVDPWSGLKTIAS